MVRTEAVALLGPPSTQRYLPTRPQVKAGAHRPKSPCRNPSGSSTPHFSMFRQIAFVCLSAHFAAAPPFDIRRAGTNWVGGDLNRFPAASSASSTTPLYLQPAQQAGREAAYPPGVPTRLESRAVRWRSVFVQKSLLATHFLVI